LGGRFRDFRPNWEQLKIYSTVRHRRKMGNRNNKQCHILNKEVIKEQPLARNLSAAVRKLLLGKNVANQSRCYRFGLV
jgi:hypothetical protein